MDNSWTRGTKIGLAIIGTTIGAGFASGREIWEFFGSYGAGSQYGILISMMLFGICSVIILMLSWKEQTENYIQLLDMFMGKHLSRIMDILMILYLLSLTTVMFSGSGATFTRWNIPAIYGILLCAILVFLIVVQEVKGFLTMNAWVVPCLILGLISISIMYIWINQGKPGPDYIAESVWPSAIIYTSMNIVPLIAVLSTFGGHIKDKKEIYVAGGVTVIGLGAVAWLLNTALLKAHEWMGVYDIPLFALLEIWPREAAIFMSLLLWIAIFTTAVSGVYGIVQRLRFYLNKPAWLILLLILSIAIPLSQFGFRNLISFLYPLFGIINLFVLALILLYPLRNIR